MECKAVLNENPCQAWRRCNPIGMTHISQQNPSPMVECDRVYKEYQAGTAGSCTLQFFHRLGTARLAAIKPCALTALPCWKVCLKAPLHRVESLALSQCPFYVWLLGWQCQERVVWGYFTLSTCALVFPSPCPGLAHWPVCPQPFKHTQQSPLPCNHYQLGPHLDKWLELHPLQIPESSCSAIKKNFQARGPVLVCPCILDLDI